MANQQKNTKGLKVIKMRTTELIRISPYSIGVCDNCMKRVKTGYYVAVLNRYICEACYQEFIQRAKRYPEDDRIENKNYQLFKEDLKAAGLWREQTENKKEEETEKNEEENEISNLLADLAESGAVKITVIKKKGTKKKEYVLTPDSLKKEDKK